MNNMQGINLIFHSIRSQGGMDRHVLDLISGFAARDIPLRVITRLLDWDQKFQNVEYVVLPDCTPFSRFNNDRFERRALQYIYSEWPTIGISRVTGNVDLAISGGTHKTHLHDKGKKIPGFFDRRVIAHEEMLYANAKVVIAHSKRVQNEIIEQYHVNPEKIIALYPPIDTSVFNLIARNDRQKKRIEFGIKPNQLMLLFPSNDHVRKGAKLILEALNGMNERIVLAVAGKVPLNHPKVINLGFCQDMPSVYAAADASILASVYEPFGLVGPESILCGTPVLLADTVGAVEVLSEPGCYRFSRSKEDLQNLLKSTFEKFNTGHLSIEEPESVIHYAYTMDRYLDEIIKYLQP